MKTVNIHPLTDHTRKICYGLLQRHLGELQTYIDDIKHDLALYEGIELNQEENINMQGDLLKLRIAEYEYEKTEYALYDIYPYEKEKPLQ